MIARPGPRILIALIGAMAALSPASQNAQPVLAAPQRNVQHTVVPYTPPTGGTYQDQRAYNAVSNPAKTARTAPGFPTGSSAHGFVPGVSKEMPLARKANTNVYANPDGTYTARIYAGAVNYEVAPNDWQPIDTTVVADGKGGFRNAAGPFAARFAADSGGNALLEIGNGASRLSFQAPLGSAKSHAAVAGSSVTYPSVAANTDIEYQVGTDRVKEFIVLHAPPATGDALRFAFPVQLNGLTASTETGGGIAIYSGNNQVFEIPAGTMSDSKLDPQRGGSATAAVSLGVTQIASGSAITVEADGKWLRDPARQYPVYIDPTVSNFGGTGDAYVRNDYPNLNQGHVYNTTLHRYEDNAGYYDSTTGTELTYMHYDLSAINYQRIISATLNIYWIWSYYVSSYTTYWIHPVTSGWNASTVTWNTRPGVTGDTITDSAVRNVWRTVTMTSWVQNWTSGAWNNNGIEIDENGNGTAYWKKIAADDNTDGSRGYIQVNYEGYRASYGFLNSDQDPATPGYPPYAGPAPNTAATLPVQVTNNGTDAWPANGIYRLSYHLLNRQGGTINADPGVRTYMPITVNPGQSVWLNANIGAMAAGSYTLQWDMVQEGITWFSGRGVPTANFRVFVASSPTLLAPADKTAIVDADRTSLIVNTSATASTSPGITKHLVEISPSPNFDAGLVVSTAQSATGTISWQTPAGALKDGARYYWRVVANDGVADSAATVNRFDMDSYQFGQRPTWPMDSIGLGDGATAAVNLATGNLMVSIPGVDLPTVSHPLTIGATYNSYAALLGAYVDDRLPFGASLDNTGCPITWDAGRRVFGKASVVIDATAGGIHQGCFWSASETYTIPVNSSIEAYVYLDATAPPQELMLQFHDTTNSWEHRAYWGQDLIGWGTRKSQGALPAAGQWVRLVVKASDVGLSTSTPTTLDGLAFTLYGGRSWFDHEGLAQSGLGPGFELGTQLNLGTLSFARLRAYDAVGNLIAPNDLATRVDRTEVRETDGTVWVFRNSAPPPAPSQPQAWPQFAPPPGVMSSLARNPDGSWAMSGQDGLAYMFASDGTLSNVDMDDNQGTQPSFRYQFDASASPSPLTDIWDPMSRHVSLAYSNGRLSTITTWDGRQYRYGYDSLQRLVSITSPASRLSTISYRDLDGTATAGLVGGVLQTVTNPRTYATSFSYGDGSPTSPLDHVARVTGPAPTSPTSQYVYNVGQTDVRSPRCAADPSTCPLGYSRRYVYDARHRVVQTLDALAAAANIAYDGSDRVLVSVDRAGSRTDSTYDSLGRPITTISPGEVSRYGAGLYAEYYDNAELAGIPKATQTDPAVDFSWGSGAPAPGVPNDVFSVRWTGYVQVPTAGDWTFYANSRDGVRVRVGNALAIDNWTTHATADSSGIVTLPAGPARISLEYYSSSANPEVHLSWAGPGIARQLIPGTSLTSVKFATNRTIYDEGLTGLRGAYYNNLSLTGRAAILRTDLGTGASGVFDYNISPGPWPGSPLGTTGFSVRWSGRLTVPASGTYLVGAISDDGVRVFVDGSLVVSNWTDHPPTENDSPPLTLSRGTHRVTIEFYQNTGGAQFNLRWQKPGDASTSDVPTTNLSPDYGLPTSTIDANGVLTTYSYSGGGLDPVRGLQTDKTIVNTNADGVQQASRWHNTYDQWARKTSETSPRGMNGATPDQNFTTTYLYVGQQDAYGRDGLLQSETVPGMGTTTYDYERPQTGATFSSGQVSQMVDQRGTWTYAYDNDGLQTQVTPPGRTQPTVTDHDPNGNVTRVSDPLGGTIAYSYNELDRQTGSSTYDNFYGVPGPTTLANATDAIPSYDAEGHPLLTTDGAGTVSYHYDPRGLVDTITDPANRATTFGYDADGRLQTKTLPNGTIVRYTRDLAGRITLLQNHKAGSPETPLADYSAIYDPLNRMSSQTGPDGPYSYSYDTLGRLETWTAPSSVTTRYYFDQNTNRQQQTVGGVVTHSYSYASDASDRLLSVDGSAYSYDPAGTGDTVGRPGLTLSWDAFGQLQAVTTSSGSVAYTRDELGRVRERIQKDGSGTVTSDTVYRYDGASDGAAYETNPAGTTITKSYLDGPDGLSVTYAGNRSGASSFDYADIHGNIVLTVDDAGNVTGGPYIYDPFGIPTNSPSATPYGFVGKWQKLTDPLSGLVLMGARPYDPTLGRFLSVDPAPGGSANAYDYANQDPVNGYDLNGRFAQVLLLVGGAVLCPECDAVVIGVGAGVVTFVAVSWLVGKGWDWYLHQANKKKGKGKAARTSDKHQAGQRRDRTDLDKKRSKEDWKPFNESSSERAIRERQLRRNLQ